MKFEYPLQWIPQQNRTKNPKRARFGNHSCYKAGEYLVEELKRLGAKNCIITSNLKVKLDGGFYTNQPRLDDSGIAIYFDLKGKGKVMACDKWDLPEHNIWALYLSVEAIRGLDRWGGSEFLDGLFTGFSALPSPDMVVIPSVQYFDGCDTVEQIEYRYKRLRKQLHPDVGGTAEEFSEMMKQYKQLKGSEL